MIYHWRKIWPNNSISGRTYVTFTDPHLIDPLIYYLSVKKTINTVSTYTFLVKVVVRQPNSRQSVEVFVGEETKWEGPRCRGVGRFRE